MCNGVGSSKGNNKLYAFGTDNDVVVFIHYDSDDMISPISFMILRLKALIQTTIISISNTKFV